MKTLLLIVAVAAVMSTLYLDTAGNPTPPRPQPPASACVHNVGDVMFALDVSPNFGTSNFTDMKHFVLQIVRSFPIGANFVHVGAISFSNTAKLQFNLNEYNDKTSVLAGITRIHSMFGETNTATALNYLTYNSFTQASGDRKYVPNIAIILTDDQSNLKQATIKAAEKLRKASVVVFAIGIGPFIDKDELKKIGSSPSDEFVFTVKTSDALQSIKDELINTTCDHMHDNLDDFYERIYGADPCEKKPCKNKGVCKRGDKAYKCTCKSGYSGKNCDKVAPCFFKPCKNKGVCKSDGKSYKCTCKSGYSGKNCDKETPKPPIPPFVDPAILKPVMHMFTRVSIAYIKGTFLEEKRYVHVEQCAQRCLNNTECKSFNFDDLVKTCQIFPISAASDTALTPSECPYKDYYQRIDSKIVVIKGATITTCVHISEYSNIKTEAACKQLRIDGNYTAMEYSRLFKGCGVTHNAEKTYGLIGNRFWKFQQILDKIPEMNKDDTFGDAKIPERRNGGGGGNPKIPEKSYDGED